jgi:transcriptional regulator with XRE-family HTH domain
VCLVKNLEEAQKKMKDRQKPRKPRAIPDPLADLLFRPSKRLLMDILRISKDVRAYINLRWLNITLATQIRILRKKRGWTQAELAERADVQVQTIVRVEKMYWGRTNPTLNTLAKIAAAFDVAMIARFVPWSQLVDEITNTPYVDNGLSPETFDIPTFEEELASGSFGASAEPEVKP